MSKVKGVHGNTIHRCPGTDDDGGAVEPIVATCGRCYRSWCARCEPTPASQCPYCAGMGWSAAPIGRRQLGAMGIDLWWFHSNTANGKGIGR